MPLTSRCTQGISAAIRCPVVITSRSWTVASRPLFPMGVFLSNLTKRFRYEALDVRQACHHARTCARVLVHVRACAGARASSESPRWSRARLASLSAVEAAAISRSRQQSVEIAMGLEPGASPRAGVSPQMLRVWQASSDRLYLPRSRAAKDGPRRPPPARARRQGGAAIKATVLDM